jgi:hypothetical protein
LQPEVKVCHVAAPRNVRSAHGLFRRGNVRFERFAEVVAVGVPKVAEFI